MARIIVKYNNVMGATLPIGLTVGELAVNIPQGRMFVGGTAGTVELAGLSGNTFAGFQWMNAGASASFFYASRGSTFGGTLQVVGGATIGGRLDVVGVLDVVGGATFEGTTDHVGAARFASTINGGTATFTESVFCNFYRPLTSGVGMTIGFPSGGGAGVISIVGNHLKIGQTSPLNFGVTMDTATGVTLSIAPRHNLVLRPVGGTVNITTIGNLADIGTRPNITVQTVNDGSGQVQIAGGNLYLGTRYDGTNNYPTDILFGNVNNAFTTTLTAPNTATSSKTITLPNTTGTVALDAAANTFTALQSFTAGISASGGVTFAGNLAINGGTITTTAATVTAFNTGAGFTLNIATDVTSNASRFINIATNSPTASGTNTVTLGSGIGRIVLNNSGGITLGQNVFSSASVINVPAPSGFANNFNAHNYTFFVGGVCASSGVTFSGTLSGTTATFNRLLSASEGISASGGTFGGLVRFTGGLSASGATFGPNVNIGNTAATTNLFLRGSINFINCPNGFLTITTGQTASGLNIEDASGNNTSIKPIKHEIEFYDQLDGDTVTLNAGLVVGAGSYTVALPSYGTTLAGLAGQQTFTGLKSFSAGISASGGATFANALSVAGSLNSTGLLNSTGGISASGGVTFNTPIVSTRIPRVSSAVFDTKTANFSPVEADNGKVFVINITGKTTVTVTLDGLSTGWRAKFLVLGGSGVSFTSTGGTVLGTFGTGGANLVATSEMVEVYCYGTNTYFAG